MSAKEAPRALEEGLVCEMRSDGVRSNGSTSKGNPNFIEIDYAAYETSSRVRVGELFDGFQSLKVITFSMGVLFLKDILPKFENCIAIVGCDVMLTNDLRRVMAHQSHVFADVKSDQYLIERINAGELEILVTNTVVAHTKLYLMSSNDGRVRTVVGSANASRRAWNGSQLESYICFDNDYDAYNAWSNRFDELAIFSTNKVVLENVGVAEECPSEDKRADEEGILTDLPEKSDLPSDENAGEEALIDDVPLVCQVKRSRHALVLEIDQNPESLRYEYELRSIESKLRDIVPARLKPKDGVIALDVETVEAIRATRRERKVRSAMLKRELPRFELDFDARRATFDGRRLDLNPPIEDVHRDAGCLLEYMAGFDAFIGDTERLKKSYFKAMTYMFASPFIARLRYESYMHGCDGYDWRYPSYMVITGEQSAGKTKFVNTMQRMMFGVERIRIPKNMFTPTKLQMVQHSSVGVPILVDEMNGAYFKYAKDIVKDEFVLIEEGRTDYPTFIILSNELRSGIDPAVAKRIFHLDVNNKMTPNAREKNEPLISSVVSRMGTAFYREYLRHMFAEVDNMVVAMGNAETVARMPDVFKVSSRVIMAVFRDCGLDIPAQMKEFTWLDCCGDKGVATKAVDLLRDMAEFERQALKVDRRRDVVMVDLSAYPAKRREEVMGNLENGLPIETKHAGESLVICDIESLESLLGMRLKWRFGRLVR